MLPRSFFHWFPPVLSCPCLGTESRCSTVMCHCFLPSAGLPFILGSIQLFSMCSISSKPKMAETQSFHTNMCDTQTSFWTGFEKTLCTLLEQPENLIRRIPTFAQVLQRKNWNMMVFLCQTIFTRCASAGSVIVTCSTNSTASCLSFCKPKLQS